MAQRNGLEYDPEPDPTERREVARELRTLETGVEGNQDIPVEELYKKVKHANEVFNKVRNPQEAVIDSSFLVGVSNLTVQKAKTMKAGSGAFEVDDFISRLISYMGGGAVLEDGTQADDSDSTDAPLKWEKIGRKALAKSRRVPATDFMLGPLAVEQKKRAVNKRAKLEKHKEDMRKPQEIKEEDIARSENETSKNVAALETLLIDAEKVNLFKFVINPNDFAQSVENIFHLSFLVRDGRVALETTDEGEPIIYACEPPNEEDRSTGQMQKRQILMQFDMATWRKAIEVFDIKEPMIPQRKPAATKIGDKWYG